MRIKFAIIGGLLLSVSLISIPLKVDASGSLDQYCHDTPSGKVSVAADGYIIYQSFKPKYNTLTGAKVLLSTDGIGEVKLSILSASDKKVVASAVQAEKVGDLLDYNFDFASKKITPGKEYLLIAEPSALANEKISWYYVQNDGGNCCNGGLAKVGLDSPKIDMRFSTYGKNESTSIVEKILQPIKAIENAVFGNSQTPTTDEIVGEETAELSEPEDLNGEEEIVGEELPAEIVGDLPAEEETEINNIASPIPKVRGTANAGAPLPQKANINWLIYSFAALMVILTTFVFLKKTRSNKNNPYF